MIQTKIRLPIMFLKPNQIDKNSIFSLLYILCLISSCKFEKTKKSESLDFIVPYYSFITASVRGNDIDTFKNQYLTFDNSKGDFISIIGISDDQIALFDSHEYPLKTITLNNKDKSQVLFNMANKLMLAKNQYTIFQVIPKYQYISVNYDSERKKITFTYYNKTGDTYW